MAIPVARVHLKVAHAALPALLPTPPKWKMLPPLLPTPCPCVAAILPKPLAKPSRADSDERWDAHKATKQPAASLAASSASSSSSSSSGARSSRGSATSPPKPKPGRADSVERWDAHKKAAILDSSSSSASSLVSSSSSKSPISRADRWDVHKEHRSLQLDDGERSSTGSNDIGIDTDTEEEEEEEEILWKPRALYAGPGFAVAAPESSTLPMPTALLVPVA